MKLTITEIGTPKQIQTSRGLAYKNYIKAEEYNDKYLNYFVNKMSENWAVGQTVEVEDVEPRSYTAKDGSQKTSLDIKFSKFNNNSEVLKKLESIESEVFKIHFMTKAIFEDFKKREEAIVKMKGAMVGNTNIPYPPMTKENSAGVIKDEELESLDAMAKDSINPF